MNSYMIAIADVALRGVDLLDIEMRLTFHIAQTLNIDESGVEKVPCRRRNHVSEYFSANVLATDSYGAI